MRFLPIAVVLLLLCGASPLEEKPGVVQADQKPTRNVAEEAICRPFLTSPKTSPLLKHVPRNFTKDEDGEFSCELVLQDVNLPAQIRVTIHEGLSLLMMRHVALGKPRYKTAVRHLRLLAQMIPSKFSFSFNAGVWGLRPPINQPDLAVQNFQNCVHGKAANDKTATNSDRLAARRYYARALAYLGRREEAMIEYGAIVNQSFALSAKEFEQAFHYRQTGSLLDFTYY